MELYFLKSDFTLLEGPVDEFYSAVWSEKYFEAGSFDVRMPRSYTPLCREAEYIRTEYDKNGECKCGRIEYVSCEGEECGVGGVLLEGLLGDRLMYGRGSVSGGTSALLGAVGENLRGLGISLSSEGSAVLPEVSVSWEWERISDWLYSVLRPLGASYVVRLGLGDSVPVLRLVMGRDLTGGAVFSSSYGNIFTLELESDRSKEKTRAYIEGYDGEVVSVGGEGGVREVYKKASDISPTKYADIEEYKAALRQRGEEVLAKYPFSLSVAAQTDPGVPPSYGEDCALGDICEVCDSELGISTTLRLTAADTVCEGEETAVYPYFGETISLRDAMKV